MPPVNDNLADARVINGNASYSDTTVGATSEGTPPYGLPGEELYDCDDVAVWYRLEWPSTGRYRIKISNVTPVNITGYGEISFGSLMRVPTTDPPPNWGAMTYAGDDSPKSFWNAPASEDVASTYEHPAGYVLYLRVGSVQTSSYPYTQWTGSFNISFEFLTPPYNPGTPPANVSMSTAQVLSIPNSAVSGTTIGAGNYWGSVWYRWEPATDVVIKVTIATDDSNWKPYGDMYHLTGNDPPTIYGDLSNDGWYTYLGDRDPNTGLYPNPGYASFALTGGQVYLMEVYDAQLSYNANFTITTETGLAPPNDRIENATVISPTTQWPQVLNGTTIDGSQDYDEVINWDGSMTPSVWYMLDNQGPGAMTVAIESLTDGWDVMFETYYKTTNHTQAGVTGMDQLSTDGAGYATQKNTHLGYADKSNYTMIYGFETNNPAGSTYDFDPLQGGEKFYIRVLGYNGDGSYDQGNFKITFFVAPPEVCFNAVDYINPASTTASIVSGTVRETQYIPEDHGGVAPYPKQGYSGWLDEQVATLIIPGADIADRPGLYAARIKYKNAPYAWNWVAGFRRNGQPFPPGAEMAGYPDSTEWMTMMAGSPHPNELDMLGYIPVQPGDEIEVVVSYNDYRNNNGAGSNLDVWQVCFQRMRDAKEAPAYKQLVIPDFPLGTTASDLGTNAQQGDLMIYKDTAPTYTSHRSTNADLCVTDDGTLWCLASWSCDGFSGNRIGPVLQKWNGSAWVIVNDDVGGFGVKRTYGSSSSANGWSLSMDTDGTDIWVCYGKYLGVIGPPGTTSYSVGIQVRKYNVAANSWSDIGSPFYGTQSNVGGTSGLNSEYTPAQAGDWGETPIIRVSPAGVPWVAFTDTYAPAANPDLFAYYNILPYVARWTGSTWDVQVLPGPYEQEYVYNYGEQEAESANIGASANITSYLGVSCVEETQTDLTNDTISFTPPAGQWVFGTRTAFNWFSGTAGADVAIYKNGVQKYFTGGYAIGSSNQPWHWFPPVRIYLDCNGSDTISIRIRKTGTGVGHIYLDKVYWVDAHRVMENAGFGFNTRYVDDGQPQAILYMHQVGDVGKGENPGVLYQCSYTRPFLSIAERDAATPPVGWASMAELNHTSDGNTTSNSMVVPPEVNASNVNVLWNWQSWVYVEWDGSKWVKKWSELIEEHAKNHVYVETVYDAIASTPPVGHFQQGFGGMTDGIDNYMTANLGGGQAFGFFGDTIVALKIGANGFEPFTDGSPGALQGSGYPQGVIFGLSGFNGWSWDTGARSIHADVNGNVWLAWEGTEGATFNYSDFVATAAMGNMTPRAAGLSGWYAAADTNESMGTDNAYMPIGHMVSSPNGDRVYILFDAFIWSDASLPTEPYTFGVYECPVVDGHIPLIPVFVGPIDLSRIKLRAYQRGDLAQ